MPSCSRDCVGSEKCPLSLHSFLRLLRAVEDFLLRGRESRTVPCLLGKWKAVPKQSLLMLYSCRAIWEGLGCLKCFLGRGLGNHHQPPNNGKQWEVNLCSETAKGLRMSESLCAHAHVLKLSRRIHLFDCKTHEPTQSELV